MRPTSRANESGSAERDVPRPAGESITAPVDDSVAVAGARLRVMLPDAGLGMPVIDSWTAATAGPRCPVVSQDDDYASVADLAVIRG